MRDFSARTELPVTRVVSWLGIARGKFFDWRQRYGKANEHNALVPRDHWIEESERQAIVEYFDRHPLEGYRRLTFMMLDEDVVAVSPATTYRVLARAGRLDRWTRPSSKKGTGFVQPLQPHEHWHIDVAYLNLGGTFYYLCSVLDGASRAIVHWDLRESMTEQEVECILQRAKEFYPEAQPRIISDNGPQFVAKDFKEFIAFARRTKPPAGRIAISSGRLRSIICVSISMAAAMAASRAIVASAVSTGDKSQCAPPSGVKAMRPPCSPATSSERHIGQ